MATLNTEHGKHGYVEARKLHPFSADFCTGMVTDFHMGVPPPPTGSDTSWYKENVSRGHIDNQQLKLKGTSNYMGMWDVWDVGCVGCGMWDVGCGMWDVVLHKPHANG